MVGATSPSVNTERINQIVERALNDRAGPSVVVADIESMLAFGVIHVFDFHAGGHRRSHENLDRMVDELIVLTGPGHEHLGKGAASHRVTRTREATQDLASVTTGHHLHSA